MHKFTWNTLDGEKPWVEEKNNPLYQKLVQKGRVSSDYYK